jgi:hypothetical protein
MSLIGPWISAHGQTFRNVRFCAVVGGKAGVESGGIHGLVLEPIASLEYPPDRHKTREQKGGCHPQTAATPRNSITPPFRVRAA